MTTELTPSLEFPFEPPCPDQLEGILAIAVDRGEGDKAASARATVHRRTCGRCRNALEWLANQQRALTSIPWRNNEKSEAVPRALKRFEAWLDGAVARYSSKALASATWRLAMGLAFSDARFAAAAVPLIDESAELSDLVAHLDSLIRSHTYWTKSVGRQLLSRIDTVASLSRQSSAEQITLARSLCEIIDTHVCQVPGRTMVLRASLEWIHGDTALVPRLLATAAARSEDLDCRSAASAYLAVWEIDRGHVQEAILRSNTALALRPTSGVALRNRIYLESMLGRQEQSDSFMQRYVASLPHGTRTSRQPTRHQILKFAEALGRVLDLNPRVSNIRALRLVRGFAEIDSNRPGPLVPGRS
jgi:hypothetical protein